MKGLIFMPTTNSEGKRDTTGAFQPEALKFAREHNIHPDAVIRFDNNAGKPWRRAEVLDALKRRAGLSCVAFFCHGWANGIQAGFDIATVAQLAGALADAGTDDMRVPLYCCSTAHGGAGGDGGFADRLRDALAPLRPGVSIVAHDTVGHCTTNPSVRRFDADTDKGGRWIVPPGSDQWQRWRVALQGKLRLRFPFMTDDEVRAAL